MKTSPIKAIIFDLDGVLIDAVQWHKQAFLWALNDVGIDVTDELHDTMLNGLPTKRKLEILGVPDQIGKAVVEKKKLYTWDMIHEQCEPDHEKTCLIRALKMKGYKLAVCSNATTDSVYRMLERSSLLPYMDRVYGNTDVKRPKPDPEIYQKMMIELDVTPAETVIVEDSPHGVEAAKASLAKVLVVPSFDALNMEFMKEFL